MTTILLYLLVQFNIGTSDTSTASITTTEDPTEIVQNTDGGKSGWDDGD